VNIPDYRMPLRDTQPVRQFQKIDSSHIRHGLKYE
jgi:hypothetical protein